MRLQAKKAMAGCAALPPSWVYLSLRLCSITPGYVCAKSYTLLVKIAHLIHLPVAGGVSRGYQSRRKDDALLQI